MNIPEMRRGRRAFSLKRRGRELMVELFDGQTKNLIAPLQALPDYPGGVYPAYRYDRSARFRFTHIPGENVRVSGIFFAGRTRGL